MLHLNTHQRGLIIAALGVLVITPDALFVRLIAVDHWTLAFWRTFLQGSTMLAISWAVERKSPILIITHTMTRGWLPVSLIAFSATAFIYSITHTLVANTLVILASMPMFAALISLVFLRIKLGRQTVGAITFAMVGVMIVFWGRLGSGDLAGDLLAIFCAVSLAGVFACLNARKDLNAAAVTGLGSLGASLISTGFGGANIVTGDDLFLLVIVGVIILPIAFSLITQGAKMVSPSEVSLIMLLETALGPFWVWFVLSEQPPIQTLIGGGFIVCAIVLNAAFAFKPNRWVNHTRTY